MQKGNDGTNNTITALAGKIGALFSSACGTIPMVADEDKELQRHGNDMPPSTAFKKTHPCHQPHAATSCLCTRRCIASSSLLKVAAVKLRLKSMGNEGKSANAEVKTEVELCKKRILMGEKCIPLNRSGVLHYDTQGIILPED